MKRTERYFQCKERTFVGEDITLPPESVSVILLVSVSRINSGGRLIASPTNYGTRDR